MCQEEDYTPSGDKEAFLTKSTKSVLSVLSKFFRLESMMG